MVYVYFFFVVFVLLMFVWVWFGFWGDDNDFVVNMGIVMVGMVIFFVSFLVYEFGYFLVCYCV